MGLGHSPFVTSDNLVLYLDAANTKSYSISQSTWNDLSGNNNTATMIGSVPFITDIVPCFDFSTATGPARGVLH